jgi:2-polyprenyl-6-methoxyphenol hydroxylase-like FAD-dependent oxidoreductase
MYDVIVVGARCAGAPTAMLLARAGYRVLLMDKVLFPRDTLSSHYIHQPGVDLLDRWGLLGRLREADCPPIEHISYEAADVRLDGCSIPVGSQRAGYAPRRYVLDPILAEGAVNAGVEFREECHVRDLLFDGDRVSGVKYTTPNGQNSVERANLVVGADGMRSLIARLTTASMITEDRRMTCTYYSYWEGLPAHFELYERPGRWIGVIPTNDALTLVMTYFPQAEFERVRTDAESAYMEAIRTTAPRLFDRMATASRVERLYGTGDQQNFLRQAAGPGWVLVGDAAHHKDSIAARGITDAFIQAQLIVDAIGVEFGNKERLDVALRRYSRDLENRFMGFYRSTLTTAELRVPESRVSLLRAISKHQDLVDKYFGTLSGACALDDFYNERLLNLLGMS